MYLQLNQICQITKCSRLNFFNIIAHYISEIGENKEVSKQVTGTRSRGRGFGSPKNFLVINFGNRLVNRMDDLRFRKISNLGITKDISGKKLSKSEKPQSLVAKCCKIRKI